MYLPHLSFRGLGILPLVRLHRAPLPKSLAWLLLSLFPVGSFLRPAAPLFPKGSDQPERYGRVTGPFGPFALAHELVRLIGANKIFRAIRLGLLPGLLGPIPS